MYKVVCKGVDIKCCSTLNQAMDTAKRINQFVTITGGECDIVGMFGVEGVVDGKCPNGDEYTWKKRRV